MTGLGRAGFFLLVASCVLAAPSAEAQRRSRFKLREPAFLRSFRPVVEDAYRSVVRFERFDERDQVWVDASLGAIVDTRGFVLSKSSELVGTLRASTALHQNLDATVVSRNSRYDVGLVRVSFPKGASVIPVEWADTGTSVGRWVITAGIDRMPVAVGVVSVAERTIAPSNEPPYLGIMMDRETQGSPKIESFARNSAADRAGLLAGDVIRKINNRIIGDNRSLQHSVRRFNPGDDVTVTIIRDGVELVKRVTLQHAPPISDNPDDPWNNASVRSRWSMMNELGSRLSARRDNFPNAVQHDTVLRPEDCGGIALNLEGKAVGINIARSGRTESLMISAASVGNLVPQLLNEAETHLTSTERAAESTTTP